MGDQHLGQDVLIELGAEVAEPRDVLVAMQVQKRPPNPWIPSESPA
jgi:hypothetical protein